jgi:CRP/FNR family transcriptional regulator, cyclic AMP receptor protein
MAGVEEAAGALGTTSTLGLSAALQAAGRRRRFGRNEVLFHAGDPGDVVHVIVSGRVVVRADEGLGSAFTLDVLSAGDVVGEMAVLQPGQPRMATVRALEPTETVSVDTETFRRMRTDDPDLAEEVLAIVGNRLRATIARLVELLRAPAETRVRRRLLDTACTRSEDGSVLHVVDLTQDEIACLAGTTRNTVNRVLRSERDAGSLMLKRRAITILDRDAISRRAR